MGGACPASSSEESAGSPLTCTSQVGTAGPPMDSGSLLVPGVKSFALVIQLLNPRAKA